MLNYDSRKTVDTVTDETAAICEQKNADVLKIIKISGFE